MTFIRFVKYTEIKQNRLSINLFIIPEKGMCQSSNYIYFHIQLNTPRYLHLYMLSYRKVFKSDLLFLSGSFLPTTMTYCRLSQRVLLQCLIL